MPESITVVGTGYVGLVSGTCFAEIGHKVICVDRDAAKIEMLGKAQIPIYEPGLQQMVAPLLQAGRLSFTTHLEEAVAASDIIFIAVGTPALVNGDVDLSQVEGAVKQIAISTNGPKVIVMKSTVPVGTNKQAEQWMQETMPVPFPFSIVSNPEFLREGSAVPDTFHMDRVVIGARNSEAAAVIAALHEPFGSQVVHTDPESAELIKYASNAFLAAKISFVNEMANVCERVGADIGLVAKGMGLDRRIGSAFLNAGIGYGGSCFPKDTAAQLRIAQNVDYDFKILRSVIEVNRLQRERFAEKIVTALGGEVQGKCIAVMGLAFKPNTDDLRDAPSLDIIEILQRKGALIRAYDPAALKRAACLLPDMTPYEDPYEALANADAMVIVTEWESVKELDLGRVKRLLNQPLVIDGRNCYLVDDMRKAGFRYISIGREEAEPFVETIQ